MAGEVIAVGEDVKLWKVGDRVCANFALDHLDGDTNPEIAATAQGGAIDGVLTEYKLYPSHVSLLFHTVSISLHHLSPLLPFLSIFLTKKHPHSHALL